MLTALLTTSTAFYSCKDYDDERVDAVESQQSSLQSALQAQIDALKTQVASINSCTCDVSSINSKISDLEAQVGTLNSRLTGYEDLEVTVTNLSGLDDVVDGVKQNITSIKEQLQSDSTKIATLTKDFDDAISDMEQLYNMLRSSVNSVALRGIANGSVYSLNLPVGLQSSILAGYYGNAEAANSNGFPRAALSSAERKVVGTMPESVKWAQGALLKTDTIGTVYVRVNPDSVDFSNKILGLVTTGTETAAGVELTGLKISDTDLKWGLTRSADNHGFYEAKAVLKDVDKAKLGLEDDLKDIAKQVLNEKTNINLSSLGSKIVSAMSDMGYQYDLKATYNGVYDNMSVYSDQALAAWAIKPLSYNTLAGAEIKDIPHLPAKLTLESLGLGNLNLKIGDITIGHVDDITKEVDIVINGEPGGKLTIPDYEIQKKDDGNYELVEKGTGKTYIIGDNGKVSITVSMDNINAMLSNTADQINSTLKNVNDQINDLLKGVSNNKVFDAYNTYVGKVNTLIDKVNSLLDNPNGKLQPVLVASINGNYQFLSTSAAATAVKLSQGSALPLYMTSYTAELLAPAYKKYIAVTDAFSGSKSAQGGDAACIKAVQDANSSAYSANFNQVLEGNTLYAGFGAPAGYVYEITYAAVDFYGHTVARKFYVNVVK